MLASVARFRPLQDILKAWVPFTLLLFRLSGYGRRWPLTKRESLKSYRCEHEPCVARRTGLIRPVPGAERTACCTSTAAGVHLQTATEYP